MMSDVSITRRRRHDPLAGKFASPEERRAFFAELGRVSNAGRLTLTHDETRALVEAYRVLGGVAARAEAKVNARAADQPSDTDAPGSTT